MLLKPNKLFAETWMDSVPIGPSSIPHGTPYWVEAILEMPVTRVPMSWPTPCPHTVAQARSRCTASDRITVVQMKYSTKVRAIRGDAPAHYQSFCYTWSLATA